MARGGVVVIQCDVAQVEQSPGRPDQGIVGGELGGLLEQAGGGVEIARQHVDFVHQPTGPLDELPGFACDGAVAGSEERVASRSESELCHGRQMARAAIAKTPTIAGTSQRWLLL